MLNVKCRVRVYTPAVEVGPGVSWLDANVADRANGRTRRVSSPGIEALGMTPKEQAESLMNSLIPFAKKMLETYGEFYPFGGFIRVDGQIVHAGAQVEGEHHPPSRELMRLLLEGHRQRALAGKIVAAATVYAVTLAATANREKTNAIQVDLDTASGYSAEVFFPYSIEGGHVAYGKIFAQKGANIVFANNP
jgi:hypothetical protein